MGQPYKLESMPCESICWETLEMEYIMLDSKDLGSYVFRTLMCIIGEPWSKQDV